MIDGANIPESDFERVRDYLEAKGEDGWTLNSQAAEVLHRIAAAKVAVEAAKRLQEAPGGPEAPGTGAK